MAARVGRDGTGRLPDGDEWRPNRALRCVALRCVASPCVALPCLTCAGRRSQRRFLPAALQMLGGRGQSGEAGSLVGITKGLSRPDGHYYLVRCSRQPRARMASPGRHAQKERVGNSSGTGAGNCCEHEHEHDDDEMRGPGPGPGPGTRPGQVGPGQGRGGPSAKRASLQAQKHIKSVRREMGSRRASTQARTRRGLCEDGCCRRGVEGQWAVGSGQGGGVVISRVGRPDRADGQTVRQRVSTGQVNHDGDSALGGNEPTWMDMDMDTNMGMDMDMRSAEQAGCGQWAVGSGQWASQD